MATTIQANSITAASQLLYTTANSVLTRTYCAWSYSGNKAIYLDIAGTIRLEPNTSGSFDRDLKTITVRAIAGLPTSGTLTIDAVNNTNGLAPVPVLPAVIASYDLLPAIALDGQEALVPRLVGGGFFRVRYMTASSRWGVCPGEVVAAQTDPHSVVTAGSTANVDITWLTVPAGIIGDGEEWEFSFPTETGANTGSDTTIIIHASSGVLSASTAANSTSGNIARFYRSLTVLARTFQITNASVVTGIQRNTIDSSVSQPLKIRITPATIGNSTFVRHAQLRRVA